MALPQSGITELTATTRADHAPTLVDNIFDSQTLLGYLLKKGSTKSGERLRQPILYVDSTDGPFAEHDVLPSQHRDVITDAYWEWRLYQEHLTLSNFSITANQGKNAVLDLLGGHYKRMELAIRHALSTGLFSAGGNAANGKAQIDGLGAAVDDGNPTAGNYGNINRTTYTWWRATDTAVTPPLEVNDLITLIHTITIDGDRPDIGVTTKTVLTILQNLVDPAHRYVGNSDKAQIGFPGGIPVMGIPVVEDSHCTSGYLLFLNTNYLSLDFLEGGKFEASDIMQPTDQDAITQRIKCYLNLCCSNPRTQGRLTGITS